jgi:hypothetical protein
MATTRSGESVKKSLRCNRGLGVRGRLCRRTLSREAYNTDRSRPNDPGVYPRCTSIVLSLFLSIKLKKAVAPLAYVSSLRSERLYRIERLYIVEKPETMVRNDFGVAIHVGGQR